jgi:hypothetical protein
MVLWKKIRMPVFSGVNAASVLMFQNTLQMTCSTCVASARGVVTC